MSTLPSKHHQPLHNFSLPFLKWGHRLQTTTPCRRRHRTSPPSDPDLHTSRSNPKFLKTEIDDENGNGDGSHGSKLTDAVSEANGDVKPWNLRPRRCVIDAGDGNGDGNGGGVKAGRSAAVRGGGAAAEEEKEEERGMMKKKRRLWISLSKDEIEEDIYAFTGSRPSRRPKKRNKIAQKQVDNVFPGLYLAGISADSYRV